MENSNITGNMFINMFMVSGLVLRLEELPLALNPSPFQDQYIAIEAESLRSLKISRAMLLVVLNPGSKLWVGCLGSNLSGRMGRPALTACGATRSPATYWRPPSEAPLETQLHHLAAAAREWIERVPVGALDAGLHLARRVDGASQVHGERSDFAVETKPFQKCCCHDEMTRPAGMHAVLAGHRGIRLVPDTEKGQAVSSSAAWLLVRLRLLAKARCPTRGLRVG